MRIGVLAVLDALVDELGELATVEADALVLTEFEADALELAEVEALLGGLLPSDGLAPRPVDSEMHNPVAASTTGMTRRTARYNFMATSSQMPRSHLRRVTAGKVDSRTTGAFVATRISVPGISA